MYKKILVPLASTDESQIIFSKALEIAKKNNSSLKLFHCLYSEVYFTPYGTFTTSEVTQLIPQWRENLDQEEERVKR